MGTTGEQAELEKDDANGAGDEADLDKPAKKAVARRIEDLVAAVRRLEAYASSEAKRVSGQLIPEVEERAKKNIWTSLLVALGLGMVLGLLLGAGRRRRG